MAYRQPPASDGPDGEAGLRRNALAEAWANGLARAVFTPMSRQELWVFVASASRCLADAVAVSPPALDPARDVGLSMVRAGLIADVVTPATSVALSTHLPPLAAANGAGDPVDAAAQVQAAVLEGYLTGIRQRVLSEQEAVRRAEVEARRATEEALRASEARFRAIFIGAGVGIGIADMKGQIVDANQAFASMLGYTVAEFCRLQVTDFVYADDAPGMWDLYQEIIDGHRDIARVQKRYRHKHGHVVWTELTASLIRDADGTPQYTVAIAEDVTARRRLQEELRHQAVHDPLTQLPNRTLFQERLSLAFARRGSRVGVCYLDLDHFKIVNDSIGHHVGDALLVTIARRLRKVVGARGHLAARIGGDEFVLLVEDPPAGELARLADAVLSAVSQPVRVLGHELAVSASMGVIERTVDDTTPAEMLKAADATLYWAKSDGRGRWAAFDADRNAREITRNTLTATLLPGLVPDQLVVHYQPIVDLRDGHIRGVEALVRWQHPSLGRLDPVQFIDLAEETGGIVALGRHVLATACQQVARWNADHPGQEVFVSVNLAVRQAQEPNLVDDVTAALAASGLPGPRLQLELTESALLGPEGSAVEALTHLADTGIRIAIDDFGTGYSNLGYLPRLPLHTLKLAGSLVENPSGLRSDGPFLTDLITLAHGLGLHVTA